MDGAINLQEVIAESKDQLRGMWRYRWWASMIAWIVSGAGWFYVYSLPDTYLATAKVYLDTQSLMDPMFQGLTVQDDLVAQANVVSRALLTRPNLEDVARATDLHLRAESPAAMERLVTRLQSQISVRADQRRNTFDISFEDPDRAKAREVVAEIVNAFVENSLQGQGDDAAMTSRAVDAEIRNHEERLLAAEDALAIFKKQNLGYMPNERGDYYGRLQAAMESVDETERQLRSLEERRDELRRQLDSESPALSGADADSLIAASCSQQPQIAGLRAELATLELNFTDKHPRIQSLRETISTLVSRCESEMQAFEAGGVVNTAANDALESSPVYQNIRILLSNTEVEIASMRTELRQQQEEVSGLRADVDKIADVEKNLKQLNRDYDVVQSRYQELLSRRETLQSKERLAPVADTVPFRTLEPPFAAASPTGPPRTVYLFGVFVIALGLGGAASFGLNMLDPVFFTRKAIRRITDLPVLGSVSIILTPAEARARRRSAVVWAASCAILVVTTAIVVGFQQPASLLLRDVLGSAGI